MDVIVKDLNLGIQCESYKLTSYLGEDLALRFLYNRQIIEKFFSLLHAGNHCNNVSMHMDRKTTLFVASVKANAAGIGKVVLRIEGDTVEFYSILVDEVIVKRNVANLKLKSGLTKCKLAVKTKAKFPEPNASTVTDSKGCNWTVPEDWLKELACK